MAALTASSASAWYKPPVELRTLYAKAPDGLHFVPTPGVSKYMVGVWVNEAGEIVHTTNVAPPKKKTVFVEPPKEKLVVVGTITVPDDD